MRQMQSDYSAQFTADSPAVIMIDKDDIEGIFGLMILGLELSPVPRAEPRRTGFMLEKQPFSFTVKEAEPLLEFAEATVHNGKMELILRWDASEQPQDGEDGEISSYIDRFMVTKLIHCPGFRTQAISDPRTLLQPTPKGLFLLDRFCKKNAISDEHASLLLRSDFNTMHCFSFKPFWIDVSDGKNLELLSSVVFQRMMGRMPNIYDPSNLPDDNGFGSSVYHQNKPPWHSVPLLRRDVKYIPPYHHPFFTHPDSESVCQYYVSHAGLRIFENFTFDSITESNQVTYRYLVTGKAVYQWLMECLDLTRREDVMELASAFLTFGLLAPVTLGPSEALPGHTMLFSRQAYYSLTEIGAATLMWDQALVGEFCDCTPEPGKVDIGILGNDYDLGDLGLSKVFSNFGLTMLLQSFTEENLCAENISFSWDMKLVSDLYFELSQYRSGVDKGSIPSCSSRLRTLIYGLCHRYLLDKSPMRVNVDSDCRNRIEKLLQVEVGVNPDASLEFVDQMQAVLSHAADSISRLMAQDTLLKFSSWQEFAEAFKTLAKARAADIQLASKASMSRSVESAQPGRSEELNRSDQSDIVQSPPRT